MVLGCLGDGVVVLQFDKPEPAAPLVWCSGGVGGGPGKRGLSLQERLLSPSRASPFCCGSSSQKCFGLASEFVWCQESLLPG